MTITRSKNEDVTAGQGLRRFGPSLGCHASTRGGEGQVGGDRSTRQADHVARPATTWHQTNLSKSVEVSFTPINTPLMVKVDTPDCTCISPLVNVPVY
jgi:hypothetical protein